MYLHSVQPLAVGLLAYNVEFRAEKSYLWTRRFSLEICMKYKISWNMPNLVGDRALGVFRIFLASLGFERE